MHYGPSVILLWHAVLDAFPVDGSDVIQNTGLGSVWPERLGESCDGELEKLLTHPDDKPRHSEEGADPNGEEAEDKEGAGEDDTAAGEEETCKQGSRLMWILSR